jgi:hypothetical protein
MITKHIKEPKSKWLPKIEKLGVDDGYFAIGDKVNELIEAYNKL